MEPWRVFSFISSFIIDDREHRLVTLSYWLFLGFQFSEIKFLNENVVTTSHESTCHSTCLLLMNVKHEKAYALYDLLGAIKVF